MKNKKVELKNIMLPIRVMHEHLDTKERIDELSSRIDILDISVEVTYQNDGKVLDKSYDGVWNYYEVYNHLCLSDVQTVTGPLEGILDDVLLLIEKSVLSQNLNLKQIIVSANRMGLAVGYPQLIAMKTYREEKYKHVENKRSAGICEYPLVVLIDHSWLDKNKRIEHKDLKRETLKISFNAETVAKTLSVSDLSGLYNYAGLIHTIEKIQGITINGPVEQINEKIAELLEEDAKNLGLDLYKIQVKVERSSFARGNPIFTLEKFYD